MKFVLPDYSGLEDKYIEMFKEILSQQWIDEQIKKMYYNNQFKEAGAFLNLIHPIMRHYVDVWASARKAKALGSKIVLMGVGNQQIVNLGRNLYELNGLYDINEYKPRLQKKELFEDACWELEVAQAFKSSDYEVKFEDSKVNRYDFTMSKDGESFVVECKNKHNEDEIYIANQAFSYYIGSRLIDKLLKSNKEHLDIKISIKHTARIEDAKKVLATLREMETSHQTYMEIEKNYIIEILNGYRHISIPEALDAIPHVRNCFTGSLKLNSEINKIYTDKSNGTTFTNRIFCNYPDEDTEVKNLRNLIQKADKQIGGLKGCLMLKVPFSDFKKSSEEVKKIMKRSAYNNIHVLKVIALKSSFKDSEGVRTDREEEVIINDSARNKLPESIVQDLSKGMLFRKHKKMFSERI